MALWAERFVDFKLYLNRLGLKILIGKFCIELKIMKLLLHHCITVVGWVWLAWFSGTFLLIYRIRVTQPFCSPPPLTFLGPSLLDVSMLLTMKWNSQNFERMFRNSKIRPHINKRQPIAFTCVSILRSHRKNSSSVTETFGVVRTRGSI